MATTPVIVSKVPSLWPLWPGPASAAGALALGWISDKIHPPWIADTVALLSSVCIVFLTVFYFMIAYRATQVMETQPDWWGSFTPAGVVWRQLIPFYGLFVLYQWLREIERYLDWRLGGHFRVGLLTFFAILLSSLFAFNEDYGQPISLALAILSFFPLYRRLRLAISIPPPVEGLNYGNHRTSTLGL